MTITRKVAVLLREIVVEISSQPGSHGAGSCETYIEGDRGGDTHLIATGCAHGVGRVHYMPDEDQCDAALRGIGRVRGWYLLFGLKTRAMPGPGTLQVRKGSLFEVFQPLQASTLTVPIVSSTNMTEPYFT